MTTADNNSNIPMDVCSFINDENDELCESIESTNLNDDPTTIYISGLLEKLTNEMIIKEKDSESVNIILPDWFQSLHPKYQKILFTILTLKLPLKS